MTATGAYFDGRTSRAHDVRVTVDQERVAIAGDDVSIDVPRDAVDFTEPVGLAPRFLRFTDGAVCEIADLDAYDALLGATGAEPSLARRLESSTAGLTGCVALLVVGLAVAYVAGVPFGARVVADRTPRAVTDALGTHVLATLDQFAFETSRLPEVQRDRIMTKFYALRWPGLEETQPVLYFRHAPAIGANAIALPSNEIVMTDALVDLARNDDALLGVLAHEVGHLRAKHGLRTLLQNSIVGLFFSWAAGDLSIVTVMAPAALLNARYSRAFEEDADAYAVQALRANGLSPEPFARLLESLAAAHADAGGDASASYFSAHPATAERVQRIRRPGSTQ